MTNKELPDRVSDIYGVERLNYDAIDQKGDVAEDPREVQETICEPQLSEEDRCKALIQDIAAISGIRVGGSGNSGLPFPGIH